MDKLIYGFSKFKGISLIYADVTEAAKSLEQKHLSGPTASRFLGQALAVASILSADLGDKDERVSIQVRVDGPIGGCVADASREGNLRGYTQMKILNDFDEKPDTKISDVLGKAGQFTVIRSNSRMMLENEQLRCDPFNFNFALARYYNDRKRQPTAVEIVSKCHNFNIERAVGLKMSRMNEGISEDFVPLLEKFNDHSIEKALSLNVDIKTLANTLGLEDLQIIESRPLTAKCTCSREKVLYSVSCLPAEELQEILEKHEEPEVTCHFCSTTYHVTAPEVVAMLREKQEKK